MRPDRDDHGDGFGSRLAQDVAEILVKAGLEALIASGLVAALFLGALALLMRDPAVVLSVAATLFLVLFLMAIGYIAALQRRDGHLAVQRESAAVVRSDGLETLVQQLRAVDLEMTAVRCQGRSDPEQSLDEARRDCVRVVLRPVYNHLLREKPGRISVAFHEWREDVQRFHHVVGTPEFRPAERDAVAQLDKDSAAGRALAEAEPNVIASVAAPEARQRGWKALPLQRESGSSIQVPVFRIGGRTDGEWLGIISADSDALDAFTAADGDLVLEFAVKVNVIYEGMFEPAQSVDTARATS